jgi:hypothetical protein
MNTYEQRDCNIWKIKNPNKTEKEFFNELTKKYVTGPHRKKTACDNIDASSGALEILSIVSKVLETAKGDILHHKNRTKTGIQKAIDRAFYRFLEQNKLDDAFDLKDSGLVSRSIDKGRVTMIGNRGFFTAYFDNNN